jgi:CheY-like chemotaxis protein
MLQTLGYYNVSTVGNGKEAIRAVQNNQYDIVFMDVMVNEVYVLEANWTYIPLCTDARNVRN